MFRNTELGTWMLSRVHMQRIRRTHPQPTQEIPDDETLVVEYTTADETDEVNDIYSYELARLERDLQTYLRRRTQFDPETTAPRTSVYTEAYNNAVAAADVFNHAAPLAHDPIIPATPVTPVTPATPDADADANAVDNNTADANTDNTDNTPAAAANVDAANAATLADAAVAFTSATAAFTTAFTAMDSTDDDAFADALDPDAADIAYAAAIFTDADAFAADADAFADAFPSAAAVEQLIPDVRNATDATDVTDEANTDHADHADLAPDADLAATTGAAAVAAAIAAARIGIRQPVELSEEPSRKIPSILPPVHLPTRRAPTDVFTTYTSLYRLNPYGSTQINCAIPRYALYHDAANFASAEVLDWIFEKKCKTEPPILQINSLVCLQLRKRVQVYDYGFFVKSEQTPHQLVQIPARNVEAMLRADPCRSWYKHLLMVIMTRSRIFKNSKTRDETFLCNAVNSYTRYRERVFNTYRRHHINLNHFANLDIADNPDTTCAICLEDDLPSTQPRCRHNTCRITTCLKCHVYSRGLCALCDNSDRNGLHLCCCCLKKIPLAKFGLPCITCRETNLCTDCYTDLRECSLCEIVS